MTDSPEAIIEILKNWQRDLGTRMTRARLIFELVDSTIDTEALEEEAARFLRCAKAVEWLHQKANEK
jgi:hypothetical protein